MHSIYSESTKLFSTLCSIGILVALNWLGYYFWNIARSALVELEQEVGRAHAFEFLLCNSGMYPQGRPVRPRSHLNFQIP